MIEVLTRISDRLRAGAYANEAAVSHNIVSPILRELGWDTEDPQQFAAEYTNPRGRVDFALLGLGRNPAVFIEVKAVGKLLEGDRQLFEYAFHSGAQLCVLTDGREWNFYIASGGGSYDDRRVYQLRLDERSAEDCRDVLLRYLQHARVRDGSAVEAAQAEHKAAMTSREGARALPAAWAELVAEADVELIDRLLEKAEALCGYRPADQDALQFLEGLGARPAPAPAAQRQGAKAPAPAPVAPISDAAATLTASSDRAVNYVLFGATHCAPNASRALVEILGKIVARDPARIPELREAVRTRTLCHVGQSAEQINPARPDLARPEEFYPGWLVGLTISNRTKMSIIRAACAIYGLAMPADLSIELPNG
jgi:predicted type IV restriction endonuclease